MKSVISIDAESNDLYGSVWAVGVVVLDESGNETDRFVGRLPEEFVTSEFARKNVLPVVTDIPVTHESRAALLEDFWSFWQNHKENADAIAHISVPVESGLFRACVEQDTESRMFEGPFPLHEVGTVLKALGEDSHSVDGYNKHHALDVPFDGSTHHPLYDAYAAAVAWRHALGRLNQ